MKRWKHYTKQKELKKIRSANCEYTIKSAKYEKRGDFVTVKCELELHTGKGRGNIIIRNFPWEKI